MITLTSTQLDTWLNLFLWPLSRILGVMVAVPIFSETSFPVRAKIGLALLLTFLIAPTLAPLPQVSPTSGEGLLILLQQFIIGVAMGFVVTLVFAAAQMAGEIIGLQMGLSYAVFFDPQTQGTTQVLSQFFEILTVLIFLSINGHLVVISVLNDSFAAFPITPNPIKHLDIQLIVNWGAQIFTLGLTLALPLIAALLITNLGLGVLTRAAPQLNIFAVGFPATLFIGFIVLTLALPYLLPGLQHLLEQGLQMMARISNIQK